MPGRVSQCAARPCWSAGGPGGRCRGSWTLVRRGVRPCRLPVEVVRRTSPAGLSGRTSRLVPPVWRVLPGRGWRAVLGRRLVGSCKGAEDALETWSNDPQVRACSAAVVSQGGRRGCCLRQPLPRGWRRPGRRAPLWPGGSLSGMPRARTCCSRPCRGAWPPRRAVGLWADRRAVFGRTAR